MENLNEIENLTEDANVQLHGDTNQSKNIKLRSNNVVVQSPTSFTGSAIRIWKLTLLGNHPAIKIITVPSALFLIAIAWVFCAVWLFIFGILLVPWRIIRRQFRKHKRDNLRHKEMMQALSSIENK